MGHNVDLGFFGMQDIACRTCKTVIDISEVDIDCDLHSNTTMRFHLNLMCENCEKENQFSFKIVRV